jgi:hypothetical protein
MNEVVEYYISTVEAARAWALVFMIYSTFTQSFDHHCIGQDVTIDIPELPDSSDPILLKNLKPIDDSSPDLSPLCGDAPLAFEIGLSALKSFYTPFHYVS